MILFDSLSVQRKETQNQRVTSGVASIGVRGASAPLDSKKCQKSGRGKKLGKREEKSVKNREKERKKLVKNREKERKNHFAPHDK